jgi:hypothetical protein
MLAGPVGFEPTISGSEGRYLIRARLRALVHVETLGHGVKGDAEIFRLCMSD